MEILALLLIGILIGIPVIAIVALVRSRSVERRFEESLYDVAELKGEISTLRRELAKLTKQANGQSAAPHAETPAVPQPAEPQSPARSAAPATPAAAPLRSAPEPVHTPTLVPLPAASLKAAPVSVAPFQAPAKQTPPAEPTAPSSVVPAATPAFTPASLPANPPLPAQPRVPAFAVYESRPPRKSFAERLRTNLPLEQFLGMNLFAKIGIVLLVLGFALLGRIALISMGPAARVVLIYAVAGILLGGGIWLEKRERYALVGRTGIGGGWALLFFTTYAMHHVAPMMVLQSNTIDCVLMLVVAVAMVVHTLRYRSQLVTGLAFLLAFSTVALSQDSVYALVAGVILAVGIVAIALRMNWFELEVFGIFASYANHFYWLYKLYPDGFAGHAFPQFWPSAIILVLYWAIFRISYVSRTIRSPREESISTVAALANAMLLLGVFKFQSIHPELAFYALLGLGALEFLFGQFPVTRKRRAAFALLTVVGTLLIFAAIPFKFSGNNIALLWMIAAEALLAAGVVQREVLFRRLGLLAGAATGLLIVYESWSLVEFRGHSEALQLKNGILLLTCALLFYMNALFVREKWRVLFGRFESVLASTQSFLGCVTAFLGVWAIFTSDWTAIGWAVLLMAVAVGARHLKDQRLLAQAWLLAGAAVVRGIAFNCRLDDQYPHHSAMRLLTLPLLALAFYCTAWVSAEFESLPISLRTASLWAGSFWLTILVWLELPQPWVALVWVALAVALCLAGRRLQLPDLNYQEHVLGIAAVIELIAVNLEAARTLERYLPLAGSAAAFYAISRFCTQKDAVYRRPAAWLHAWIATGLLAALAWHESPQPWLAVIWILFALALALVDRAFSVEELPWQAHTLSLLAVIRAASFNFFDTGNWHGVHVRLLSVAILVAGLYTLARWVRMPERLQQSDARHAYTWVATGLAAWLLWSEMKPVSVALALGVFALLLFEIGAWQAQRQLRFQAYALLAASFCRIFLVNLAATTVPGEAISPRIYTVAPLAIIYFYIWSRLQSGKSNEKSSAWPASNLIAYFGSGSIVALLYYQLPPEWIVASWAVVISALMAAALLLDNEVFLEQTSLLTLAIVVRGLAHNIFGSSYFSATGWRGNFSILSITAALLLASLPFAFRIRSRYADRGRAPFLSRWLAARRPDQTLFFAPLILVTVTIAVKMNEGMVTLAWGIVGVAVILLGLFVNQRSYRLAALFLLLVCVAKIVVRDAWRLDERDRYITFIVLGAALILVSALYSKYRDQVSRLL